MLEKIQLQPINVHIPGSSLSKIEDHPFFAASRPPPRIYIKRNEVDRQRGELDDEKEEPVGSAWRRSKLKH